MAKETDTAVKLLAAINPAELLLLLGLAKAGSVVTLVDTELSNAVRTPDKLIRVDVGSASFLVHVEYQSTPDVDLDARILAYNVWARLQYGLPVVSVVVLLLATAYSPQNTGRVVEWHDDDARIDFAYRLIRLYDLPVDPLLAGPVTTLPFALLAAYPPGELPAVVDHVRRRLAEAPPTSRPKDVWAAARFLLDRRYTHQQLEALMLTDAELEQTATYQRIITKGRTEGLTQGLTQGLTEGLSKGRVEGSRQLLLEMATAKFGPPPPAAAKKMAAATDPDQFARWANRLMRVNGWDDLFR